MKISCEILGFHFNLYLGKEPEEQQPEESALSEPQIFDSGVTSSMPMHVDPAQDPRNFGFFYQEPFVPKSPV